MNLKSTLFLCNNVDLDPNYNYTIDFDNIQAQEAYFDSKVANVLAHTENYSYIRDNQSLKVFVNVDDIVNVNYMFFNNGNKRYYAFILKKDYVSPTCTSITFKIDVMQSFMFDYSIDESFIDREHQDRYIENDENTLKPKLNLLDENLETGENRFIKQYEALDNNLPYNIKYVTWAIALCKASPTDNPSDYSLTFDKAPTGLYVYLYPVSITFNDGSTTKLIRFYESTSYPAGELLEKAIEENPNVLSIEYTNYLPIPISISLVEDLTLPEKYAYLINFAYQENTIIHKREYYKQTAGSSYNYYYYGLLTQISQENATKIFNFASINDYDLTGIINKTELNISNNANIKYETKLLLSPYRQLKLITGSNDKDINTKSYNFTQIKITELFNINYSKYIKYDDIVNSTKDDILDIKTNEITLATDRWTEYEMNNKASLKSGLITNLALTAGSLILGYFTGGVGWAVAGSTAISTLGGIANEMTKRKDIKDTPDEVRNAGSSFISNKVKYNNLITLQIYDSVLKENNFKYFLHYGYKCNEFKKPNVRSRYYFNYIKTIGANIKSNISADYKNEIAEIFNNGITLWHYRSNDTFKGVNNYDYENVEMNLIGGNNG